MAEFTAVGPARDLDGPLPIPPKNSLLETEVGAGRPVVVEREGGRWLNGVNIWPYPPATPSTWEPCSDGTWRTKAAGEPVATVRFDSFVVYLPITCSSIGFSNMAAEEFGERAQKVLDATLSMGVENGLAAGVATSTNPFFADTNVTVLGGAAVSPGIALSYLEEAIGQTGRGGMIHATPAVIAALQAFPVGGEADRRLITANGTPVVSGDGYIGINPPGLPPAGTTEDYIFATGPVEVRLGPVSLTSISETLDRGDNVLTFRAEYYVLATWDTQLQSAVLVDWSL